MHSFGTVWRQDTAILPYTSCDGQAGLVPHGFRERQLMGGETEGWGGTEERGEMEEWRFWFKTNIIIYICIRNPEEQRHISIHGHMHKT